MAYIDFISSIHTRTKRDYIGRVNEFPKDEAATVAKKFDRDYWDGDRKYGYGGFYYDGRWKKVAENIIAHYNIKAGDKVLDVGSGKAFLLFEISLQVPGLDVVGFDFSRYALLNGKEEIRSTMVHGTASALPFKSKQFDLVISINTLHNLYCYDLESALKEISRVSKDSQYIVVESYRNETEKANLLYWQLTCESFYTPLEWEWWFTKTNYTGDHSFIFFE